MDWKVPKKQNKWKIILPRERSSFSTTGIQIFVRVDVVIQGLEDGHRRTFSSETKFEIFNFVATNATKRKHLSNM